MLGAFDILSVDLLDFICHIMLLHNNVELTYGGVNSITLNLLRYYSIHVTDKVEDFVCYRTGVSVSNAFLRSISLLL